MRANIAVANVRYFGTADAGVDVERTSPTVAVNASVGREAGVARRSASKTDSGQPPERQQQTLLERRRNEL
jgi:hypothetical protein